MVLHHELTTRAVIHEEAHAPRAPVNHYANNDDTLHLLSLLAKSTGPKRH
jgi:predicted O-methyltransferase YrrM